MNSLRGLESQKQTIADEKKAKDKAIVEKMVCKHTYIRTYIYVRMNVFNAFVLSSFTYVRMYIHMYYVHRENVRKP